MVGTRHFTGMRTGGGRIGAAGEMMRFEIQKKGKLPAAQRYKRIMNKKLEENKQKALGSNYKKPFSFSNKISSLTKMSARAEQALKEIAEKKARKLAKEERQMVIVQPRNFHNGHITAKGDIFDIAGNKIARVNTKNGSIVSASGWGIGKYKPKSMFANMTITGAIDKYSPYFINLRKMQMLQAQGITQYGVHGQFSTDVINVHGASPSQTQQTVNLFGHPVEENSDMYSRYGSDLQGPRQNVGVTAWGARADNVHGVFADNTWGATGDNVWGTYNTDVWGGVGGGSMWGQKSYNVWNTGNGVNYIKGITNFFAGLFGITTKKNREAMRQMNALAAAYKNSAQRAQSSSGQGRSATPAPTARR